MFTVAACGDCSTTVIDEQNSHLQGAHYTGVQKYGGRKEIELVVRSDETWLADDMSNDWTPVGTYESLYDVDKSPEVFFFAYEPVISYRNRYENAAAAGQAFSAESGGSHGREFERGFPFDRPVSGA